MRYKLTIAYRGTCYHGWQRQLPAPNWKGPQPPEGEGLPTVQENLARALVTVVNHPVVVIGSSRTDAGVHAKGQVAHFDTDQLQIPPEGIMRAANSRLPDDIAIVGIKPVPDSFHAIRSTLSKRYQYIVWHSPVRPTFYAGLVWYRWQELDFDAMAEAAPAFIGTHDFKSFARPGHGRQTTIRTIMDCRVSYRAPRLVIGIEGSGFLWNQIRIMVGTLVQVGLGQFTPADVKAMIEAKDRRTAGSTAPAYGLYLQWVRTNDGGEAGVDGPGLPVYPDV